MSNTLNYQNQTKSSGGWFYMFFLFVSFLWVAIFPATSSLIGSFELGYGNLLNFQDENTSTIILSIISEALYLFISFEIVFYIYRYFLTFKIYSFVVPSENLKTESRTFYIYRNVIYGIFCNLCFICPYIFKFLPLLDVVVTLLMLLVFASHLNKKYAEPIIGHFVFKNFCYPIFFYEALILLIQILEVL